MENTPNSRSFRGLSVSSGVEGRVKIFEKKVAIFSQVCYNDKRYCITGDLYIIRVMFKGQEDLKDGFRG